MLTLLVPLAAVVVPQMPVDRPPAVLVGPYLQNVTPHAITVMWETDRACKGLVRYGRGPEHLDRTAAEAAPTTIHELRLSGLDPRTPYHYTVQWQGSELGPFRFRTAPAGGDSGVRIAIYGDSRTNAEIHRRVVEVMGRFEPDLVLNSGDLVTDGRIRDQWKPQFFDPLAPLIRRTPIFTVLGNHENNADPYYDYFDLPNNEAWWSVDYGHVHILGLDSCQPFGPGSPQYAWAERDLRSVPPDRWIVVVCHHPMFSAHPYRGVNANRWAWQPLFQRHGVDLVFTGHDHHYQRCHPIGSIGDHGEGAVVHFTSGGGGAGLYPVATKPWTAAAASVHNATILDFDRDRVRVRAFSDRGKSLDDCEIVRNRRVPAAELVSYEAIRWEQELRDQVLRAAVVEVDAASDATPELPASLRVPSLFPEPLSLTYRWRLGPAWRLDRAAAGQASLGALRSLELPLAVRASAPWPGCLPLPSIELELLGTDGERRFRNDTTSLLPFRVWPRRTLACTRRDEPIAVDGEPIEWEGVVETSDFCVDDGSRLARTQARVRTLWDPVGLCVFAYVDMSDDRVFQDGSTDRDAGNITGRDESFAVLIRTDEHHYIFAVNTRNAQLDAVDRDRTASPGFESAVHKAAATWYCEIRIPSSALAGEIRRIDFAHRDRGTDERSLWVPTLGDGSGARYGWLGR